MGARTISGHLAEDPISVMAGALPLTKFVVVENTFEYRNGKKFVHPDTISHHVEAAFQLGENVAASLRKGMGVIVTGTERGTSWPGEGDNIRRGTVLRADDIGPSLLHAVAQVMKTSRVDDGA